MRKFLSLALVVIFVIGIGVGVAMAENDNPCNGGHYNLNIIGVSNDKTADMDDTHGHTIFVALEGKSKIMVTPAPEGEDFQVLDRNAMDGDPATFQLPPDVSSSYMVVARALGKPCNDPNCSEADITTCYVDPNTGEDACYGDVFTLKRYNGRPSWSNVSKYLLTITVCYTIGGVTECVEQDLFEDSDLIEFWSYDNKGLKLAQLRLYPIDACAQPE